MPSRVTGTSTWPPRAYSSPGPNSVLFEGKDFRPWPRTTESRNGSRMLNVDSLEAGYGPMQVLWQPSLEVRAGSITSLLGPNGVGKSTFLLTVLGSLEPWGGTITFLHDLQRTPMILLLSLSSVKNLLATFPTV